MNSDIIKEKIDAVYESGATDEWNRFWDNLQDYGNRQHHTSAFVRYWSDETFKPKYRIWPIYCESMFYNCSRINHSVYTELLDFSRAKAVPQVFCGCSSITKLGVLDFRVATSASRVFEDCTSLESIDAFYPPESETANVSGMFTNCGALRSLTIKSSIVTSFDFGDCSSLDQNSLISILDNLSKSGEKKTITFSESAVISAFGWNEDNNTFSDDWTSQLPSTEYWTVVYR